MNPTEIQAWLADQTSTVLLVIGFAYVYVRFILPRQQAAEVAREASFQKVLNDSLEERRKERAEAIEREERQQRAHEAALAAQERRHAEDRKSDREMHRETITEFTKAVRDNTVAIRHNSALTLALGENLNIPRDKVAQKASTYTGQKIDPKDFETKDIN